MQKKVMDHTFHVALKTHERVECANPSQDYVDLFVAPEQFRISQAC